MDFYDTLNVGKDASSEEVRTGYLAMSRLHHPDKGASGSGAFRDVNRAYRILSDPTMRTFYDKHGSAAIELVENTQLVDGTDKLLFLEKRVRTLIRTSEEMQAQRWLQPSVSLTMGSRVLQYSPMYCSWSHTATSAGVSLGSSVSVFVSSHTQRGGVAVSRASLLLGSAFSPTLTLRGGIHVMGGRWPSFDLTVQKQISEATIVRQVIAIDNGTTSVGTEWIQQLGESILGTLGLSLSGNRGVSFELAKQKQEGSRFRGKLRLGLVSSGDVAVSGKVKLSLTDKLEVQVGPSLSTSTGLAFDVALQTELPTILEEQEGAFPSYFTWSLSLGFPRDLTVGLKLSRGGYSFNFPIELPEAETKWALIAALSVWTLTPVLAELVKRVAATKAKKNTVIEQVMPDNEGEVERASIMLEAAERKALEEQIDGLIIIQAVYADEIDVSNVLMARVRNSTLTLSSSSKSTLLGFRYPTAGHNLSISYKYGGKQYDRIFMDNDIVILP